MRRVLLPGLKCMKGSAPEGLCLLHVLFPLLWPSGTLPSPKARSPLPGRRGWSAMKIVSRAYPDPASRAAASGLQPGKGSSVLRLPEAGGSSQGKAPPLGVCQRMVASPAKRLGAGWAWRRLDED